MNLGKHPAAISHEEDGAAPVPQLILISLILKPAMN